MAYGQEHSCNKNELLSPKLKQEPEFLKIEVPIQKIEWSIREPENRFIGISESLDFVKSF